MTTEIIGEGKTASREARKRPAAVPQMMGGGAEHPKRSKKLSPPTVIHPVRIVPYVRQDFLDHSDFIEDLASNLMSSELDWDLPIARWIVRRGLAVTADDLVDKGKGIPSGLVLMWGDEAVGVSIQKSIDIETSEKGPLAVTQHFLRAIKPDFRGDGWGGNFLKELLKIHQDGLYAHCSQAVATFRANMQSGQFEPETYAPFEVRHDVNNTRRELLVGYWKKRKVHGKRVNESTGVSKYDFPQRNKNFRPESGHKPTEALFELITSEEFGMEFPEDPNAPKDVGTDSLSAIAEVA